ncbi:GTP-binding protein, HSR1-related protein [Psychromonas ingrahamii 37]|uniref:GTP-binding protein, HSR1-related protein n=1 Tax=Psychromonas ingrahamii (strain DSM 17664 / CCUG 51855 / 37) TaxID=357804 RepID=A1SWN0_PSYIN|nr:GTPase [Psychromonas ingrahamii]ABM03895.1 GTP-binding protein, HSR1-related protein [Psychromonas ingrahamii 37]
MNKIKDLFLLLSELSGGRWGIAVISAVLPMLAMMGFGLFLAIKYDYILALSLIIALSTLIISLPLFLLSRVSNSKHQENTVAADGTVEEGLVKASADWSQNEMLIWARVKLYSRELLAENNEWSNLDSAGIKILEFIALEFDKEALNFSLPEGLKVFEEVSKRYRKLLDKYGLAIEALKISHLKAGYDAYDKYGEIGEKAINIAIWANHAKNAYLNPSKFAIDLLNQQSTSGMTKGFFEDMQLKAKQALLDEVSCVAIDLYSGRFSFDEENLSASTVADKDQQRMVSELEPIRIVMVGQTNAGKSSIINVLKNELVAEVDILPSTKGATVYTAMLNDAEVRIVDLHGLNGDEKKETLMLLEMTHADLIVWVLKANQPARDLDKKLKAKFDDFYLYAKHISRKKPAVICVVNQVDKLKPVSEWQPPYNLDDPTTVKAKIISQAVAYNHKLLMPDSILALSIALNKKSFNIEKLKQVISQKIANASNVQRNRQRVEAIYKGVGIKKQFGRVVNSSKKLTWSILTK